MEINDSPFLSLMEKVCVFLLQRDRHLLSVSKRNVFYSWVSNQLSTWVLRGFTFKFGMSDYPDVRYDMSGKQDMPDLRVCTDEVRFYSASFHMPL